MNSIVKNREKLQNMKKIKDILKRFSIISLSLIFTLMSFTFSFAADFNNQPIPKATTSQTVVEAGFIWYTDNGINNYIASNKTDTYLFCYIHSGYTYIVGVHSSTSPTLRAAYYDNGYVSLGLGNSYEAYDSNSNLYYSQYYVNYTAEYYNIPYFNDLDTGLQAIRNGIDNGFDNDNERYPFTLQNGYLFVYDCGQSNTMYSFDLSSKSEEYSDIGSIPFPDTNQSYWFSDSLPEIDITTIPDSDANLISWQKGDKTNIFGQTQDMIATISGTSSGRYLYIYNPPVHYNWSGSSNPTASETINYPMIINGVSENENWYIYDSIARLTDFNQGGSVTGTVTGENIIGFVSSDGAISFVTSSGAIYTQNSGGSTDISGANGGSLAENINGLKETLDNFVNQFIQLLSAPISHIQQLIQSSHQFFDVFSQLFEWLPSDLSSVIVSGLIIMVVIGVIKMLL